MRRLSTGRDKQAPSRSNAATSDSKSATVQIYDFTREQVAKRKLPPSLDKNGQPAQIDGTLTFSFETKIGVPLPELNDAETRALAITIVEPDFSGLQVHKGDAFSVQIGVNEEGKVTGTSLHSVPQPAVLRIMDATKQWTFRLLLRDGKPQHFHGNLKFIVP